MRRLLQADTVMSMYGALEHDPTMCRYAQTPHINTSYRTFLREPRRFKMPGAASSLIHPKP